MTDTCDDTDATIERRLREWHDDDNCSECWDSRGCSGDCVTMRELRKGVEIALAVHDIRTDG